MGGACCQAPPCILSADLIAGILLLAGQALGVGDSPHDLLTGHALNVLDGVRHLKGGIVGAESGVNLRRSHGGGGENALDSVRLLHSGGAGTLGGGLLGVSGVIGRLALLSVHQSLSLLHEPDRNLGGQLQLALGESDNVQTELLVGVLGSGSHSKILLKNMVVGVMCGGSTIQSCISFPQG